jgi:RNA-directed DNA polymerase
MKKTAAVGFDEVSWSDYELGHEERLADLHGRLHRGPYRAQPSKRIYIPKPDGRERPIGIALLEGKIVQKAIVWVLQCIYEQDFVGFSYGFRPGKSQHQALDALTVALKGNKVNWVLVNQILGTPHRRPTHSPTGTQMANCWRQRGWRMVKVNCGYTPGAVISPLLGNVFLHYVFDLWIQGGVNSDAAAMLS